MEFTTTEKGNRKLIHEIYIYVFQNNPANDVTSWECERDVKKNARRKSY